MQKGLLFTLLCVVVGLLGSEAQHRQNEGDDIVSELAKVSLRLTLMTNRYRQLCQEYAEFAKERGAPAINCTQCPDGWLHIGDQCFILQTDKNSWSASAEKCKEVGGHLAILTTKEQHEIIEREAKRLGTMYTFYWIGLSDTEHEGEWKWVDNTTLTTPFWNKDNPEPDNNQTGGEEGEDCAVVNSYNRDWFDVPCMFRYPRICQKDEIPLE